MPNPRTWTLPPDLDTAVSAALREWTKERKVERLWARDATLWTGGDEASWLGWLEHRGRAARPGRRAPARSPRTCGRPASRTPCCSAWAARACAPRSSRMTFGAQPGCPELHVLDSTDPAQVAAAEAQRRPRAARCSSCRSKSGTTLEPNIFKQYFFERVHADRRGRRRRAAASSPSPIPGRSSSRRRRRTASATSLRAARRSAGATRRSRLRHGAGGGRWASTSRAARRARARWSRACAAGGRPRTIPGVALGRDPRRPARAAGRDKLTLVASPGIDDLAPGSSSSWPSRPARTARA